MKHRPFPARKAALQARAALTMARDPILRHDDERTCVALSCPTFIRKGVWDRCRLEGALSRPSPLFHLLPKQKAEQCTITGNTWPEQTDDEQPRVFRACQSIPLNGLPLDEWSREPSFLALLASNRCYPPCLYGLLSAQHNYQISLDTSVASLLGVQAVLLSQGVRPFFNDSIK